jgi:hypothetical protein
VLFVLLQGGGWQLVAAAGCCKLTRRKDVLGDTSISELVPACCVCPGQGHFTCATKLMEAVVAAERDVPPILSHQLWNMRMRLLASHAAHWDRMLWWLWWLWQRAEDRCIGCSWAEAKSVLRGSTCTHSRGQGVAARAAQCHARVQPSSVERGAPP